MSIALQHRLEFAPPAPPGMLRAFGVAVAVHLLLAAALGWGVNWRHQAEPVTVEAELWAAVPVRAAPKLVEAPPPVVAPPTPQPVLRNADIAVEQEKKPTPKIEPKAEPEKPKPDTKLDAKRKAEAQAKEMEAQRQENLARMTGLAGATGAATATGTAQRSAAPTASYAASIRAAIGTIFYAGDGNPVTDVEFRTTPTGLITSRRITKPSGNKAWDDAVQRKVDAMETLPRNADGVVPSPLTVGISPNK